MSHLVWPLISSRLFWMQFLDRWLALGISFYPQIWSLKISPRIKGTKMESMVSFCLLYLFIYWSSISYSKVCTLCTDPLLGLDTETVWNLKKKKKKQFSAWLGMVLFTFSAYLPVGQEICYSRAAECWSEWNKQKHGIFSYFNNLCFYFLRCVVLHQLSMVWILPPELQISWFPSDKW